MAAAVAPSKPRHNWAISPLTRANGPLISNIPTFALIGLTIYINKQPSTHAAYAWLNKNFTPFQINAWISFAITSLVYWIGGCIFMVLDLWEPARKRVEKWKIQPEGRVSKADYKKVLWIVARNQLLIALPLSLSIGYFVPLRTTVPLPGAARTIASFFFCLMVEEAGFFYVHRFFHSPKYYKDVHKMHHKFTAPVAFSSTYCTLTEHCFSNILPIILGVLIIRAHWCIMVLFFCALEIGTLCTHSGYNFPGSFNALQHDWHHYSFTENFGPTGILDQLHGTNKSFKSWLGELGVLDRDNVNKARQELSKKKPLNE